MVVRRLRALEPIDEDHPKHYTEFFLPWKDGSRRLCSSSKGAGSGGVMVLGELPVSGRPTDLDSSRERAYCPCSRCGWGLFGHFFSHLSFGFE